MRRALLDPALEPCRDPRQRRKQQRRRGAAEEILGIVAERCGADENELYTTLPRTASMGQSPAEKGEFSRCLMKCRLSSSALGDVFKRRHNSAEMYPSASNNGSVLIEIHVRSPSGLYTPIMIFEHGCPVRMVTATGNVSPGKGEPSSWIARQRGSSAVRPVICSADSPRIRSALPLHARMLPLASRTRMPFCIAAMTDR